MALNNDTSSLRKRGDKNKERNLILKDEGIVI